MEIRKDQVYERAIKIFIGRKIREFILAGFAIIFIYSIGLAVIQHFPGILQGAEAPGYFGTWFLGVFCLCALLALVLTAVVIFLVIKVLVSEFIRWNWKRALEDAEEEFPKPKKKTKKLDSKSVRRTKAR